VRWLVRRADFQAAAKGRRVNAPPFALQMRRRAPGETLSDAPRFGLTATRKIGGAVERNRMKRRLRAALRGLGGEEPGAAFGEAGHDYVVVLRREALAAPFDSLLAELRKAMRKAHDPRSRAASGAAPGSFRAAPRTPDPPAGPG
jgi:ribonuclease P protein component